MEKTDFGTTENQAEQEELELNWQEADAYRHKLFAKLDDLIAEGIFTASEAQPWFAGAEACGGHAEWVQELIDYLEDKYEPAGEVVLDEIETLLESPLFTRTEAAIWWAYATKASYQEKLSLIGRLTITMKQRRAEQEKTEQIKYSTVEDLVNMIRTAIKGGELEKASALLLKLNPAEYKLVYIRLNDDLEKAKIQQTHDTLAEIMIAA